MINKISGRGECNPVSRLNQLIFRSVWLIRLISQKIFASSLFVALVLDKFAEVDEDEVIRAIEKLSKTMRSELNTHLAFEKDL